MFRSEFSMNNMNAWIPPTLLVVSWCTGRSLGTFLGPLGSRGYLSVVVDYANPFYHSFPTPFLDVVQLENPIKTSAESLPSNHWNMECATKNWGSSESKRTSKLVYVIKWPKCCRGVSWLRNAKSSKPCLVLTGWITCIHHMQGCRHQPAELDLCDFLQNEKENKAYSDKYANLNFKAFIKIKIQSRWEEPKEKEEKKKVSLLYNIHLPKFEHKHLLRWCDIDSQRLLH